MHELLRFLLVGFVAGWIGSILARGSRRVRGCLTYVVTGMAGGVAGGLLTDRLRISEVTSVAGATIGAVILLVIMRSLRSR
jgi:uncharacterized membrane protein YeaQ/YmgE (transglycosylase-associated protein family)